jgi:hypothetical protein
MTADTSDEYLEDCGSGHHHALAYGGTSQWNVQPIMKHEYASHGKRSKSLSSIIALAPPWPSWPIGKIRA